VSGGVAALFFFSPPPPPPQKQLARRGVQTQKGASPRRTWLSGASAFSCEKRQPSPNAQQPL
jgi:hypothetical protein